MSDIRGKNEKVFEMITTLVILLFLVSIFIKFLYY
jgi:hypothetical protein